MRRCYIHLASARWHMAGCGAKRVPCLWGVKRDLAGLVAASGSFRQHLAVIGNIMAEAVRAFAKGRVMVPAMSVNSFHPDYEIHRDLWQTLRDVMAGDREMKRAGIRYVPRLEGQSDADYRAYVERGFFYNATARTLSGYLGMIFRREPVVKLPKGAGVGEAMAAFFNDCDLRGKGLESYAREVVNEVTVTGRAGTLVDWADGDEDRAYLALYRAEDIINWREERIKGRMQLSLVVLREAASDTPGFEGSREGDDLTPFVTRRVERLRVLRLVPGANGPEYRVDIWGKVPGDGEGKMALMESITPTRRGKPLPNIPFVFHGPNVSRVDVEESPIADIVAANLAHYRMDVDYKHGMHFTALPTAWVSGFEKDASLRIGASAAWVTETIGATAGFLEFKGDGLRTFERAMDRVERLLAVLGARLLESQKRVSESAEALQLRQVGDSSVIASLSVAVSKSLNQALQWVYWWHSTETHPNDVSADTLMIELNRDFDMVRLTGKEIQALVMAWQSMAISQDTMLHQFERGDVLPPGRSPDEELALIKANPPPTAAQPAVSANPVDRGEGGFG
jgi:hypothetical protein